MTIQGQAQIYNLNHEKPENKTRGISTIIKTVINGY